MRVKIISLPPYKNNLISSLRRNERIDFDSSLKAERERLKYISQLNKASVNYHWKSYEGRSLKRGEYPRFWAKTRFDDKGTV